MEKEFTFFEGIHKYPGSMNDVNDLYTFLEWFLKRCYPIFQSGEEFIFMNVHYFPLSVPTHSRTKNINLPGIPTIVHDSGDPEHTPVAIMKEVLAFLLALSVLDTPSREGVEIALRVFREKFIIETIRLTPGRQVETPFSLDPYTNILSIYYPDYYEPQITRKFFGDFSERLQACYQEEFQENGIVWNGEKFLQLISEYSQSLSVLQFFQEVHLFLNRKDIKAEVENYSRLIRSGMQKSNLEFSQPMIENFVQSMFLHSWLKSMNCTTIMPVVQSNENGSPPAMAVYLINTRNPLRIETINTLHVGLKQVIRKLHGGNQGPPVESEENSFRAGTDVSSQRQPRKHIWKGKFKRDGEWRNHIFHGMVGKSDEMKEVFKKIRSVARFDTDVLILGESGTGKEEVARIIHDLSPRKEAPFLPVSLAERADTIVESELFGYEKGAFTGAYKQSKGYFEQANGGTIFFDELSHIPPAIQAKLLRVLQTRRIQRVGGNRLIPVNVKVLSASNEDLTDSQLREDIKFLDPLFYRLQHYIITIPPLRKHKCDIPLLVDYFLSGMESDNRKQMQLSANVMDCLMDYHWPGNVRQLMSLLNQAFINAYDEGEIRLEHFEFEEFDQSISDLTDLEHILVKALEVLRKTHFHISEAMQHLEETVAFHPNRKTMMRYCRELCLWFLAKKQWDLQMAIRAMAGREELEESVARKFRDYFLGDKSNNGVLTVLSNNPEKGLQKLMQQSLVRKKHEPLLRELVDRYRAGFISPDKWAYILRRY